MKIDLTTEEARLVSIYRAINDFNKPELLDAQDVGAALMALEASFDLAKEETDLTAKELKTLIRGFVAGLGAAQPQSMSLHEHDEYLAQSDHGAYDEVLTGGPSGGVLAGQGEHEHFVTQSGVHQGQND